MKKLFALLLFSGFAASLQAQEIPRPELARDVVGVTHVAGKYNFTDKDFLNEGADQILALGSRVIKVWFHRPQNSYPFNSQWPEMKTLVEMAQAPHFKTLFDKPFTTFILEAYAPGRPDHYYKNGMTPQQIQRESDDFYALSKYLLETYKNTGKTFVLQNWEGDWSLIGAGSEDEPTQTQIEGMVAWFNARQDGVEKARREVGTQGVMVAHAAEVNLIKRAMNGKKSVTNDVVPRTRCDLYSSSAYDIQDDAKSMTAGLDYLAAKAPDSPLYGAKNLFIGEFGFPENNLSGANKGNTQRDKTRTALQAALRWGVRYAVYWELYCNEPIKPLEGKPINADMRGFWLVRPDGSKAPTWNYLQNMMNFPVSEAGLPFIENIRAFEAADKKQFPAPDQIVFVGSSSFTNWSNMARDLAPYPTIRRGFGGSQLGDSLRYAERIIIPYKPKMVVIYAGDNDIAAGRTPLEVFEDFKALVAKVHGVLPQTKVTYLSIKPSLSRWHLIGKIREANNLIEGYAKQDARLSYIDIFPVTLGPDGKPKAELFLEDGLHINQKGYDLWAAVIKEHLASRYTP
ncbi:MAG TPA: SGNH/GDSL hydrolase family protein [Abditibacteriaceae bacterium]|jgi:lysophospholipase L1-like esterase